MLVLGVILCCDGFKSDFYSFSAPVLKVQEEYPHMHTLKIHMYEVLPPGPQNGTVFEDHL